MELPNQDARNDSRAQGSLDFAELEQLRNEVRTLRVMIERASISATCNGDGTITVTWRPGI